MGQRGNRKGAVLKKRRTIKIDLDKLLFDNKLTVSLLAKRMKINQCNFLGLFKDNKITMTTVLRIEKVLGDIGGYISYEKS